MTPQQAVESTSPKTSVARVVGVFASPRETFADIGARPSWIVPILLMMIMSLGSVFLMGQRIGWDRIVRQSLEKSSSAQNMSAEQMQQMVANGSKFAGGFAYVGGTAGPPVVCAIIAGVLMLTMGLFGGKFSFKQAFAIVAHASLVGIIGGLIMITVMMAKPPEDFDIQHPTVFNAGAFLNPETTGKALMSIASSIDLFTIWTMVLLAIGFSAAASKRTFTTGKAFTAVVLPFVLWVCIKAGWAAMFG